MDEVACLMGVQYTVQVIASGEGGVSHVVAGTLDSVLRRGRELLADQWLVELHARADLVLATLDGPPESLSWDDFGNALRAARNLVVAGGRIVLLTEFAGEIDQGLRIVGSVEFPRDAIQPLRESAPPDLMAATELALAADWARVYLMSGLDESLTEDLFMTPVESEREVQRLIDAAESCIFLGGAQHIWGRVV
jgi:nickel-dependent lactate racemase